MSTTVILSSVYGACLTFFLFAFTFAPLEKAYPAKAGQRFFRSEWWTDFCYFLAQQFLWVGLILSGLQALGAGLDKLMPGSLRAAVAEQPWWLQAVEVVLLSDFLVYWAHRLQHTNTWLWRFHAVHHSSQDLDWLAAHREHPLDSIYQLTIINLPPLLLGFPLQTIAGLIAFRGIWAIFIHSNVRIPLGPLLYLFGAPQLHHWHHERSRDAGNYANLCPLMDLLFGTYVCPDHEPEELGIRENLPSGFLGQMLHPFRMKPRKHSNQAAIDPIEAAQSPAPAPHFTQPQLAELTT